MLIKNENSKQQVKIVIFESINQVMIDNEITPIEITEDKELINELSFSSLMIAQLIMIIQDKINCEPFTSGYAISDLITVGDCVRIYAKET